jgi:chromosome segregation ATPase
MKNLSAILAGGLTLLVVMVVGIFSFLPAPPTDQASSGQSTVLPVGPAAEQAGTDPAQLEATLAEREATYRTQIDTLNQTLQERQSTYQAQIQELTSQIDTVQNQLNELKGQEQSVLAQVVQLESARAERLAAYQGQLEQTQTQYNERFVQLQTQLNDARTKLVEANAQLGR